MSRPKITTRKNYNLQFGKKSIKYYESDSMSERLGPPPTQPENRDRKLLVQLIPPDLIGLLVAKWIGEGLTPQEKARIIKLVAKIARSEPFIPSREVPPVYESQKSKLIHAGEENIPKKGATIIIGNHTRGGPLYDFGQFFEIARIVHDQRTQVEDECIREPYYILQRGIHYQVKIRGVIIPIPFCGPITGQFYELGGRSLNWEIVSPPKFDKNGQIINKQNLPQSAIQRLEDGGAMGWFPQGKHSTDLVFPKKAGNLLSRLSDKDIQVVPLRVIPQDQGVLFLAFGKPVHIRDLAVTNGRVDINAFVQKHIVPLGRNNP